MSHTINILRHLINALQSHVPSLPNVVGIELLNEPQPTSDDVLKAWYTQAIKVLTAIKGCPPIYISHCWQTESYADFIKTRHASSFVVLDHHLYRCFTSHDTSTSAYEHARALADSSQHTPRVFSQVSQSVPIVVGEWSGALNPGSLVSSTDERLDKKAFIDAQLGLFENHCSGWFWWTYKKEDRGDTGWSFKDAVESGIFPSWVGMKARKSCISSGEVKEWTQRRDQARDKVFGIDRLNITTGVYSDLIFDR
jgi:glucan 1,3-beta-glucosidase